MITLQGKSCRRIKDYQKNVNIVGVEKGKVYRLFTAHERCYRRIEVIVPLLTCLSAWLADGMPIASTAGTKIHVTSQGELPSLRGVTGSD